MEEYKELDITKVCSEITNEKIENSKKELNTIRRTRHIDNTKDNLKVKENIILCSSKFMNTVEIKDIE